MKKLREYINCWLFKKVGSWYVQNFIEEVRKLPHEDKCAKYKGPYLCNCAKSRLKALLWDEETFNSENIERIDT